MSTMLAPLLPNFHRDVPSLKRKSETVSNASMDLIALHVKRARTSFECDVYSNSALKHALLPSPALTVALSNDCSSPVACELSYAGSHSSFSPTLRLGAIAAVASTELSHFASPTVEVHREALQKFPPPPTCNVTSSPSLGDRSVVAESVTHSPVHKDRSFDEDDNSLDLFLDLDRDPDSEELEDANNEVWASTLLFFIGKQPRDKREASPEKQSPTIVETPVVVKSDTSASPPKERKSKKMRRRRGHFPKATTDLLKKWLFEHMDHPYPTEEEKAVLAEDTGLTVKQINYWFTNSRRRFLKSKTE